MKFTFEQLCIRKENGYTFDLSSMLIPKDPNCFDDVVYKLISKIDTSLMLLTNHDRKVENFTVAAIPLQRKENLKSTKKGKSSASDIVLDLSTLNNAWEYLLNEGWNCLQTVAYFDESALPDNGSRKYSLYQFSTCLMDVIRAHYMFQKFSDKFHNETIEMFDDEDIAGATQAVFVFIWKDVPLKQTPIPAVKRKSAATSSIQVSPKKVNPFSPKRISSIIIQDNEEESESEDSSHEEMEVDEIDEIEPQRKVMRPVPTKQKMFAKAKVEKVDTEAVEAPVGRGRRATVKGKTVETAEPVKVVEAPIGRGRRATVRGKAADANKSISEPEPPTPTKPEEPKQKETDAVPTISPQRGGSRRRSVAPGTDWSDEERAAMLELFDNLNKDVAEQKRIAIVCKYALLHNGRDLPSKVLYQWVQKKGRVVCRNANWPTASEKDEDSQRVAALAFLARLTAEGGSEAARAALVVKYMEAQCGVALTSKQILAWMHNKPVGKKSRK